MTELEDEIKKKERTIALLKDRIRLADEDYSLFLEKVKELENEN